MAKGKKRARGVTPAAGDLESIKRLLMLQLINEGVEAQDIAIVLGVAPSVISGTIPVRRLGIGKKKGKDGN